MQSFFWHCFSDPRVHETLLNEINSAVAGGHIPSSGNISWSDAQTLSYFQACLKEAMRMRPAVGLNITRYVPPEGAELGGHFFRGGTRVAVNGWVLHRDKDVFGDDAKDFRPERWLEDAENAKRMDRYMFQVSNSAPKQAGPRKGCRFVDQILRRSLVVVHTSVSAGTWRSWR